MFELKIFQWNCFSLTVSRTFELKHFLITHKPDIFLLQEIKLSNERANLRLRFDGYATYHKVRSINPDAGGGIAILIREIIPHTLILNTEVDELLGLKVEFDNFVFDIYSYYNPPNSIIKKELFLDYAETGKNFLILGDFNSKCALAGCSSTDSS